MELLGVLPRTAAPGGTMPKSLKLHMELPR